MMREGPVFPSVPVGAAQGALQAVFAALRQRERGGGGMHLRTSLVRGASVYDYSDWINTQRPDPAGSTWQITDKHGRRMRGMGFIVCITQDGYWLQFANIESHLFFRFMQLIGIDNLYSDPEFAGLPSVPPATFLRARRIILKRVREKTLAEWSQIFDADGGIAYELVRAPVEVPQHPQVAHNKHLVPVGDGWRLRGSWMGRRSGWSI